MIKITKKENNDIKEQKPFPKLMISGKGCIVLFERADFGVCIDAGTTHNTLFSFSQCWSTEDFTDYNEPITLQNE